MGLGTAYKHITGEDLSQAHNSLYDCYAQGVVLFSEQYKNYQNKPKSIETIEDVWAPKRKRIEAQLRETADPPHHPWEEGEADEWAPPPTKTFESYQGGGTFGATQA